MARGLGAGPDGHRGRPGRPGGGGGGRGGGEPVGGRGAAESGRVRLPGLPARAGDQAEDGRRSAGRSPGRPRGCGSAVRAMGRGREAMEPGAAGRGARPGRRAAGVRAAARTPRGGGPGRQRGLHADRDDAPARDLRAAFAGARRRARDGLPGARDGASRDVRGGRGGDGRVCPARRADAVGGPVGGDDRDGLPGRRLRSVVPAREPPGGGRAGDPGVQPLGPVRRGLSALVPGGGGDPLGGRAGSGLAAVPVLRPDVPAPGSIESARCAGAGDRSVVAEGAQGLSGDRVVGARRVAGRVARGPAAGRPAVPYGLADRHHPERPARPPDLAGPAGGRAVAGPVGRVEPAGRPGGLGVLAAPGGDRMAGATGGGADVGPCVRPGSALGVGGRLLRPARARDGGPGGTMADPPMAAGRGAGGVDRRRGGLADNPARGARGRGAGGRARTGGRGPVGRREGDRLRLRADARPERGPSDRGSRALVAGGSSGSTRSS